MISASRISSVSVFNQIIAQAKQSNSPSGTKLSGIEVQKALDSFEWGSQGAVTRIEILASEHTLHLAKKNGGVTREGVQAFGAWKTAHADAKGSLDLRRRTDAFRDLQSYYRYSDGSPGADKLTASEARSLLSTLGSTPGPQRVAEVRRLKNEIAASPLHTGGLPVIEKWLSKHPVERPSGSLGRALTQATRGLQWPSETDRPIDAVGLGRAPLDPQHKAQALLQAVGESRKEKVEVRNFEDTFAPLVSVQEGAGPEEKARALQFSKLRDSLKSELTDLQVYRVGTVDIDVYVLGKTQKGEWAGVMTSVVET